MPKRDERRPSKPASKRRRKKKPAGSAAPGASFALVPAELQLEHPDPRKQKALTAYLTHGTVAMACAAAAIGRTTFYEWAQQDPEFARLYGEAKEHVVDEIEAHARRRALDATNPSDVLTIFMLKSHRRATYGDKDTITLIHPEVRMRVDATQQLIASKATWDSEELLAALNEIWK